MPRNSQFTDDARGHIERIRRELKQMENCGSRGIITALQNGLEMYVLLFPGCKI